jgi:hypothetical protein
MSEQPDPKPGKLSVSDSMNRPVQPLVWISSLLAFGTFLAIFTFATLFSDNRFVNRFLSGNGMVVVAVLILIVNAAIVSLIERRQKNRR